MIIVIASFLFAYYFVNVAGIHFALKRLLNLKPHQRLKPLDCVTCLSVWMAVVFYFIPYEYVQFIAIIFSAGFVGYKIK